MSRTKTVGRQEINAEKKRSQLLEIWRRLKKNKVAVVGLVILGVLLCVAIFADVIVDYDLGIRQNMAIKLQKPSAEPLAQSPVTMEARRILLSCVLWIF